MKRLLGWIVRTVFLTALLALTMVVAWGFQSRRMAALRPWHTVSLAAEFSADDVTPESTLADYLAREDALFQELGQKVYAAIEPTEEMTFSRYLAKGYQDPEAWTRNWNRTVELEPETIQGGALLLHGLTDSPYSLRRLAEHLHAKGFYVLALRLPGHGTIPAALTEVEWEDWMAATRLAARHVRQRVGEGTPSDKPFLVAGYSNGGALAVTYALDALSDPGLPRPDRLLLFSPEIGIPQLAVIARSHKLLSFLPYFAKFKWLSILPEYDPFKYNSFPKNAAEQAYAVTRQLQRRVQQAAADGTLADFPPALTFLSWIDKTVLTAATIERLYEYLPDNGSELVIFDVNRLDRLASFIPEAGASRLDALEARRDLPYRLTIITNAAPHSALVAARTKAPRSRAIQVRGLAHSWPPGVYSLSHVAIPFAPDDPVYGAQQSQGGSYAGIPLGALQPRGETRLLTASVGQLMRLRYNPFFTYMDRRIGREVDHLTRAP